MLKQSCRMLGIALMAILVTRCEAQVWYDQFGPVPLRADSTKVVITFSASTTSEQRTQILAPFDRLSRQSAELHVPDTIFVYSVTSNNKISVFLDSVTSLSAIASAEPYYTDTLGSPMLVGTGFCVAFKPEVNRTTIDSINAIFGVSVQKEILHNVFLLKGVRRSSRGILELANLYHDLAGVVFSHPDFASRIELFSPYRLFDYYRYYQWQISKVVGSYDSASVWDFAGLTRPDTVAVLDDGIEEHEDLPASRITAGYNFWQPKWPPWTTGYRAHGMGCAGIIAASHTRDSTQAYNPNTGVISMNPFAQIMPIRMVTGEPHDTILGESKVAEAIGYAWKQGAQILNCSWGYRKFRADVPVVRVAIDSAAHLGRNGKGCVIVCAPGNKIQNWEPEPHYVRFPARYDSCIAVSAINVSDIKYAWSEAGPEIDLAAPTGDACGGKGQWTLDVMGDLGYNPWAYDICGSEYTVIYHCPEEANDKDYMCCFGGTSAAAPLVAGTASLLLARDPNLTRLQVQDILQRSAQRGLETDSIENPPETDRGWGRVDAFRAVLSIIHGDVNNSGGVIDLSDLSALVSYLTGGGFVFFPSDRLGDINCTGGVIDLADLNALVCYLCNCGPSPVKPCFKYQ